MRRLVPVRGETDRRKRHSGATGAKLPWWRGDRGGTDIRGDRIRIWRADLAHRDVLRVGHHPARRPGAADIPRDLAGPSQLSRPFLGQALRPKERPEPLIFAL